MISLIITIVYVMMPKLRPQLKNLVITLSLVIIMMGLVLTEPYYNYETSLYFNRTSI